MEYQRMKTSQLAAKIADIASGNSVDLQDIFQPVTKGENGSIKTKLECNESCSQIERNRRLAFALQIENPELTTKLGPPKYSDSLKEMAKKEPNFAKNIHKQLEDLVKLAKDSKQKSRSYSFDCMNRDKRQFVHELAQHFGCTTEAYDSEPKRNVVATAVKGQIWIPTMTAVEVVQGIRRAPGPAINSSMSSTASTSAGTMTSFTDIVKIGRP
jgi:transcriptional repressor NF-X1